MNMNDYANIVRPEEGLQVIDDVSGQPGVQTGEGIIGPLLWGESTQSYFLDIPAGAYLDEHPHPFEALIYAVKGSFVVSCRGKRYLCEPGSLMSFAADVPTGYEVPFDESAFMVVFRGEKPTMDQQTFAGRFTPDHPASLHDLPEDHPARVFARRINPDFE
jgi:quercetin dioxygenase-like cupin family protein